MDYDNTNSGTLFKNDRKIKDNQPDYKGRIEPKCPHCNRTSEFWLSAWVKTAGAGAKTPGSKFFSLALTEMNEEQAPIPSGTDKASDTRTEEDRFGDIPF